jgi:hypothetical protein
MLALMDAGISLYSTLASVSCAVTDYDGTPTLLIDPDLSEDKKCTGSTYFVYDTQALSNEEGSGLVSCTTVGLLTDPEYQSCLEACRSGCSSVSAFIRITMSRKPTTCLADEEPAEQLEKEIDASTSTSSEDVKKEGKPTKKGKNVVSSGAFMKPI